MGNCDWALIDDNDRAYHDHEWGIPVHDDDRQMFEHLSLECLQCGLSWALMLKKRQVFRKCFRDFDFEKIARFTEKDVARILGTKDMIRSERKVRAIISNARCYLEIRREFGSFCNYLWRHTQGKTILYRGHAKGRVPVSNGLSLRISKDLKKRGFRYVGPVTIYSHLQASGIINDHAADCPCYKRINNAYPTVTCAPDDEVF